ncbi:feruloyl esterase b precursor protein [Colletotrichum incanum]|nr:feruloyl esterase b precursor protein [Colletotrichum incanum]
MAWDLLRGGWNSASWTGQWFTQLPLQSALNLVAWGDVTAEIIVMPIIASRFVVSTTEGGYLTDPLLVDFASVRLHNTATINKAVTKAFYGTVPTHSYFYGASNSRRQGYMPVQSYPLDHDGIVAVFLTASWVRFLWTNVWHMFFLPCDKLDGVEDGIIPRSDLCDDFDPHIAKDPAFDMSAITHQEWDDLVHASISEYDSVGDTSDPDLSDFRRRGGKMDLGAADYHGFFVAPDPGHCFSWGPSPPITIDYIINWVEQGIAPETLRASGRDGRGVKVERDICKYPRVQHYAGGDP